MMTTVTKPVFPTMVAGEIISPEAVRNYCAELAVYNAQQAEIQTIEDTRLARERELDQEVRARTELTALIRRINYKVEATAKTAGDKWDYISVNLPSCPLDAVRARDTKALELLESMFRAYLASVGRKASWTKAVREGGKYICFVNLDITPANV